MDKNKTAYSLDYFKGMFHTYALQNDPGVNVSYRFDIDDFPPEDSLETALKTHINYFQEYEIEFIETTKLTVEHLLNGWFYGEFHPNYIKNYPTIQTVVEDLITSFKITAFYKITSLKRNGKNAENDFGYASDFIIFSSKTRRYLCELTVG